jgi:hypothetical protein
MTMITSQAFFSIRTFWETFQEAQLTVNGSGWFTREILSERMLKLNILKKGHPKAKA